MRKLCWRWKDQTENNYSFSRALSHTVFIFLIFTLLYLSPLIAQSTSDNDNPSSSSSSCSSTSDSSDNTNTNTGECFDQVQIAEDGVAKEYQEFIAHTNPDEGDDQQQSKEDYLSLDLHEIDRPDLDTELSLPSEQTYFTDDIDNSVVKNEGTSSLANISSLQRDASSPSRQFLIVDHPQLLSHIPKFKLLAAKAHFAALFDEYGIKSDIFFHVDTSIIPGWKFLEQQSAGIATGDIMSAVNTAAAAGNQLKFAFINLSPQVASSTSPQLTQSAKATESNYTINEITAKLAGTPVPPTVPFHLLPIEIQKAITEAGLNPSQLNQSRDSPLGNTDNGMIATIVTTPAPTPPPPTFVPSNQPILAPPSSLPTSVLERPQLLPFPLPHPEFPFLLSPASPLPSYSSDTPASLYSTFIKGETLHAYSAYVRDCYGLDDYHPLRHGCTSSYNMHLLLIDSLDTLWLQGHMEEYNRSLQYLRKELRFDYQEDINLFETTIRVLGSMLTLYALTNESFFLLSSISLADRLLIAFETPTRLPLGTVCLGSKRAYNPAWAAGLSTAAEMTSIQLEFQYLTRITGNTTYASAVDKVMWIIHSFDTGLYGMFINVNDATMAKQVITLGARVDSLYEYLLKQWLLSGKGDRYGLMKDMWIESSHEIASSLLHVARGDGSVLPFDKDFLYQPNAYLPIGVANPDPYTIPISFSQLKATPTPLLFVAENHSGTKTGKMDHLVCFLPAVYALSYYHKLKDQQGEKEITEDLLIAKELMKTCVMMYATTPTGLAPEIVQFRTRNNQEEKELTLAKTNADIGAKELERDQLDQNSADYNLRHTDISNNLAQLYTQRDALNASISGTPEYNHHFDVDPNAAHSLLRPETVESLHILYRVTNDTIYRAWAWQIFTAFVNYSRVSGGGYSGLRDVRVGESARSKEKEEWLTNLSNRALNPNDWVFSWSNWNDAMESFFMSETMKYLFLIFEDHSVIPIDKFVFNTEAHPLPVDLHPSNEIPAEYNQIFIPPSPPSPPQPAIQNQQEQDQQQQQQKQDIEITPEVTATVEPSSDISSLSSSSSPSVSPTVGVPYVNITSTVTVSSLLTTAPPSFLSSFFTPHCQLLRCAMPLTRCSPHILTSYRNRSMIDDKTCRRSACGCGDCLPDQMKIWIQDKSMCDQHGGFSIVPIANSKNDHTSRFGIDEFIIRLENVNYDISREKDCLSLTIDYPPPPLNHPFTVAYYHCITLLRNPTRLLITRDL